MATVTIKVNGYSSGQYKDETNINFELSKENVAALKAAIQAFEEETKLPETMRDCREFLRRMQSNNKAWYVDFDGSAEWKTGSITDWRVYPAKWQAEKLHALACMEQVWIALHDGDFEWFDTDNAFFVLVVDGDGVRWAETEYDDVFQNPFPFKTGELAEQARRILTDDLIKKAFSVKLAQRLTVNFVPKYCNENGLAPKRTD